MVQTFLRDLLTRSLHTFWQTFLAALATLYAGGGLDVHDLTSVTDWHRVLVALIAAGGASALSAVKTTLIGLRSPKPGTGIVASQPIVVTTGTATGTTTVNLAPLVPSGPPATPGSTEAVPDTPEVKP